MLIVHYCPKCSSYSGNTFEVVKYDPFGGCQNEWLRCTCGWEGQWKDTVHVKEPHQGPFE